VFIFGKIKTYIIGALALALPIIYVMGKVMGAAKEKNKVIKDELQASEKANDFYKAMAENEEDAITDRPSLIKRLRGNGL
jgi:F0F1-type ATP synthase membrane subunit b/b'|tara:strand:- start:501 stop:740 length:240 start_codon:yes stop_codon:yes gene_type:complete